MKSNLKFNKWNIVTVLIVLVSFMLGYYQIGHIYDHIKEDTLTYLSEIAKQGANLMEIKVNDQMETLKVIASMIETGENFDPNVVIDTIRPEAERNAFKRMGIILPDGQAITTDGIALDLGGREYFKQTMTGLTVVSDTLLDSTDGKNINVYATPVYDGNQIVGILFASIETDSFTRLLGVSTFSGQGYSYVIESHGSVVVESINPQRVGEFQNMIETLGNAEFNEQGDLALFRQSMLQGTGGNFTSVYDGIQRYVNYEPLAINDWYIMSVVPTKVVDTQAGHLANFSFRLIATGLGTIFILFGIILFSQNQAKKNLKKIAYMDELTGGNNWYKFEIEALKILKVAQEKDYALIFLDIKRFRFINEEYGHSVGDVLLKQVMKILWSNVGKDETCGRVSSDYFVILSETTSQDALIERMTAFMQILNREKAEIGIKEKINCNFGIYEIKDKTEDLGKMREKANMARIEAKVREGLIWFFYSEDFRKEIAKEKEIEDQMEDALENNEFEMYLQPKFNLHSNEYCGAEALVRWNRPGKGLVCPKDFIPIFERTGFITSLDIYMLEEACKALKRWKEKGYSEIKVSVNISRKKLWLDNLVSEVLRITDQYQIKRNCLEIELTESCVFEDMDRMIDTGKKLQSYGFEIAMDDFGSGYSSINVLGTLPLNTIKLDQEFFSETLENKRRFILVQSVIDLVKKLGMTVVAEGIETKEEADILRAMNCDIIQGYYFGKPMPIQEFEKLVFKTGTEVQIK
ncbi:MAG: EAL domain-containing protein [Acetobacterium sp.]